MKLVYTLTLFAVLNAYTAHAQPAASNLDLFCTQPEKFVCGYSHSEFKKYYSQNPPVNTSPEAAYAVASRFEDRVKTRPIDQAMKSFEALSLKLIAAEMGVSSDGFTLNDYYNHLLRPSTPLSEKAFLLIRYAKNWVREANAVVYNETGEIPKGRQMMAQELAKAKHAVIDFVHKRPDIFPAALQNKIVGNLQKIPLFTVYDFEENHEMILDPATGVYHFAKNPALTVNPAAEKFFGQFMGTCANPDKEGVFNAFYSRLPDQTEAIIICPGFMEKAILEKHFNIESGIFFVLGHELGHSIQRYIDAVPVLECVNNNILESEVRGNSFEKKPFWDSLAGDFFKSEKQIADEKFKRRIGILIDYAGEIVADEIGVIAMVATLSEMTDVNKKLQLIRSAWEPLCSAGLFSDGVHPSSDFRITQILRRNPLLSEAMNCVKTTPKPRHGCTLDGESKEFY